MLSDNHIRTLPPWETQGNGGPSLARQHRVVSETPDLTNITSDLQDDPPLAAVTSDLPEFGGPQSPSPTHAQHTLAPSHGPPRPAGSTPGRSRIEVVLNLSPYKPHSGQKVWDEADKPVPADQLARVKGLGKSGPMESALTVSPARKAAATATTPAKATTGKRPRGRPKGWRPGMPSTKTGLPTASAARYLDREGKIRVTKPPPSSAARAGAGAGAGGGPDNNTGQKRRGRPPRPPSPTPRGVWETMMAPRYVVFLCEWAGCTAELQNIETLRRHVRKVHGQGEAGPLVCKWAKCGQRPGEERVSFERDYEFNAHVDERHLLPFVWHAGDGHRNGKFLMQSTGNEIEYAAPAYLLGPDGEQVTPWVKEQEIEDLLTWRENRGRLKEILLQRDANAPSEDGEDEEKPAVSISE